VADEIERAHEPGQPSERAFGVAACPAGKPGLHFEEPGHVKEVRLAAEDRVAREERGVELALDEEVVGLLVGAQLVRGVEENDGAREQERGRGDPQPLRRAAENAQG
jgi:hypothetical protein